MAKYVRWRDPEGRELHIFRDGETFRIVDRATKKITYVAKKDGTYDFIKKTYFDNGGE